LNPAPLPPGAAEGAPIVQRAQLDTPVLLDSPHSGTFYPADFDHVCDRALLRRAEDFLVDRLFEAGPALGATLICAPLPRSYLDVNRAPSDLDPLLLPPHERGAGADSPSAKSELGVGLVWRLLDGEVPIYARHVDRAETQARIQRCWVPYHQALDRAMDAAIARHGKAVHVNCHSMPAASRLYPAELQHRMPYDFLLGDRDGSTADARIRERLHMLLADHGYRVGVNTIFKGVEIVRRLGRPQQQRHSLQLEINRALYMDEALHQPHEGFGRIQALMGQVVTELVNLSARL
jgi:N-formylglutamate deformylase